MCATCSRHCAAMLSHHYAETALVKHSTLRVRIIRCSRFSFQTVLVSFGAALFHVLLKGEDTVCALLPVQAESCPLLTHCACTVPRIRPSSLANRSVQVYLHTPFGTDPLYLVLESRSKIANRLLQSTSGLD